MSKRFVVFFTGKMNDDTEINGYYSEKQPHFNWSFTNDIKLAKTWKTRKGAENKVKHQQTCYHKMTGTISEVEVQEFKIIA